MHLGTASVSESAPSGRTFGSGRVTGFGAPGAGSLTVAVLTGAR